MSQDASFRQMLDRLRTGDSEAARVVFNRFAQRLIALARSRLDPRMRQKLDPEDLVQSAYKSFFVRFGDGQFELQDWNSMWSILTVITLRKCGHNIEYFRAACRDIGREQKPAASEESSRSWEAIERGPTPVEAAILSETVTLIMSRLNDRERHILSLSLQGLEVPEISREAGRSERTVRRVLERVRLMLLQIRDAA